MAYRLVNIQQNTSEWFEWKKGKIGASYIASIMGLSPFETPLMLYDRIQNDVSIPDNDAMRKGRELEPIARDHINNRPYLQANYQPVCMERTDFPWMIASLDAYDKDVIFRLREIKCPGEKTHSIAVNGKVPEYYWVQCQWQMWVSGEIEQYYDSFYNGNLVSIRVPVDRVFEEKMVADVKLFYKRLLEFDPPEPCDRDYVQIEEQYPRMVALIYQDLCKQVDDLEKQKEIQRKVLIEASGNRNCKIGPLRLTKVISKGVVSWKDLAQVHNIDPEPFRGKNRESWRIS